MELKRKYQININAKKVHGIMQDEKLKAIIIKKK